MFIKKTKHVKKVIPLVKEKVIKQEPVGFPARAIKFTEVEVARNSFESLSKEIKYNPDALEIALQTGEPLEQVSSTVLTPSRFDVDVTIVDDVKEEIKEDIKED